MSWVKSKIEMRPVVEKLKLSADDWSLYPDNSGGRSRAHAAYALNADLVKVLNSASGKADAEAKGHKVLAKYSAYGANDSEGWGAWDHILHVVYGKD